MKQARQVLQALDQPRARCGVQLARDGIDGVVRHGGHHIPARARGDHLRRLRVERQVSVGQDDHFRVALDDRLCADLPDIAWQVAEDIRATREIDQLAVEPLWSSHERLVGLGGIQLLVDPRPRCVGHRRDDRVAPIKHVRGDRIGRVRRAVQFAERLDRVHRGVEVLRKQLQHRNALATDLRQILVAFGEAQHHVRLEPDDGFNRRAGVGRQAWLNAFGLGWELGVGVDGDQAAACAEREGYLGQPRIESHDAQWRRGEGRADAAVVSKRQRERTGLCPGDIRCLRREQEQRDEGTAQRGTRNAQRATHR